MEPLAPAARRALRARAHHLHPVVTIGQHGLSPTVLKEIDVALTAHELIKVRVMGDDRNAREALLASICEALACSGVQQIGKLLVLWRPRPPGAAAPRASPRPRRQPRAGSARPPASAASRRRRANATEAPVPPARPRRPGAAAPPAGVPRAVQRRRRRAGT